MYRNPVLELTAPQCHPVHGRLPLDHVRRLRLVLRLHILGVRILPHSQDAPLPRTREHRHDLHQHPHPRSRALHARPGPIHVRRRDHRRLVRSLNPLPRSILMSSCLVLDRSGSHSRALRTRCKEGHGGGGEEVGLIYTILGCSGCYGGKAEGLGFIHLKWRIRTQLRRCTRRRRMQKKSNTDVF